MLALSIFIINYGPMWNLCSYLFACSLSAVFGPKCGLTSKRRVGKRDLSTLTFFCGVLIHSFRFLPIVTNLTHARSFLTGFCLVTNFKILFGASESERANIFNSYFISLLMIVIHDDRAGQCRWILQRRIS